MSSAIANSGPVYISDICISDSDCCSSSCPELGSASISSFAVPAVAIGGGSALTGAKSTRSLLRSAFP